MKKISPYWALLMGFLSLGFQIANFYYRLGRLPNDTTPIEYLFFFLAGVIGGWLLVFFLDRSTTSARWWLMLIAFLLATPVAWFMMLGGTLLGPLGILIFPQIPWLVAVGLVSLIGRLVSKS
jgi:hypothetical protein